MIIDMNLLNLRDYFLAFALAKTREKKEEVKCLVGDFDLST